MTPVQLACVLVRQLNLQLGQRRLEGEGGSIKMRQHWICQMKWGKTTPPVLKDKNPQHLTYSTLFSYYYPPVLGPGGCKNKNKRYGRGDSEDAYCSFRNLVFFIITWFDVYFFCMSIAASMLYFLIYAQQWWQKLNLCRRNCNCATPSQTAGCCEVWRHSTVLASRSGNYCRIWTRNSMAPFHYHGLQFSSKYVGCVNQLRVLQVNFYATNKKHF